MRAQDASDEQRGHTPRRHVTAIRRFTRPSAAAFAADTDDAAHRQHDPPTNTQTATECIYTVGQTFPP